jgi:SAM-dependent methyltransferase
LKREKVDFDQYAGEYNKLLADSTRFFSPNEAYFARYKAEVARRLVTSEPVRVFEFGCGIGRNLPFLAEMFPSARIYASDISKDSVTIARRENPTAVCWVEGHDAAPEGQFDLMFVAGVFHHVPPSQRAQVSRALKERLAPDGEVIVFEHNPFNPVTRRIVDNCPYDADAVLLRPSELAAHLAAAGLEIAGKGFILFVPPRLGALTKMDRLFGWLPLGGQYWIRARRRADA